MTTSVLSTCGRLKNVDIIHLTFTNVACLVRIPLPQIGRAKQSSRISTSAERKGIQKAVGARPPLEVKDKLGLLLNAELLAEM